MLRHSMKAPRRPGTPRVGKSKYGNKKVTIDGITFDSKKEARYYGELLARQRADEVAMFLRQVPIDLPGGVKYVIDFVVFKTDGTVEWVDVKGMKTDVYKLKKRQTEELYPIEIVEA